MPPLASKPLLDTSMLIMNYQSGAEDQAIYKAIDRHSDVYLLFFVIYEFKKGFLRGLVDFYKTVELESSVDYAYARLSQSFSTRQLKYGHILTSLILQKTAGLSNDTNEALNRIEAVVCHVSDSYDLLVNHTVGSFKDNELVKFRIDSRDDFDDFLDVCNRNKTINQVEFWESVRESVQLIVGDNEYAKGYEAMHKRLVEILADPVNSQKVRVNQGVGDAIIALDAAIDHQIVSLDKIFALLSKPLGKSVYQVDNWVKPL